MDGCMDGWMDVCLMLDVCWMYVCICVCMSERVSIFSKRFTLAVCMRGKGVCMYVWMYVRVYVCASKGIYVFRHVCPYLTI